MLLTLQVGRQLGVTGADETNLEDLDVADSSIECLLLDQQNSNREQITPEFLRLNVFSSCWRSSSLRRPSGCSTVRRRSRVEVKSRVMLFCFQHYFNLPGQRPISNWPKSSGLVKFQLMLKFVAKKTALKNGGNAIVTVRGNF